MAGLNGYGSVRLNRPEGPGIAPFRLKKHTTEKRHFRELAVPEGVHIDIRTNGINSLVLDLKAAARETKEMSA